MPKHPRIDPGVKLGAIVETAWFCVLFVEVGGIEPPSKQVVEKLSTRLVFRWIFVKSEGERRPVSFPYLPIYLEPPKANGPRSRDWFYTSLERAFCRGFSGSTSSVVSDTRPRGHNCFRCRLMACASRLTRRIHRTRRAYLSARLAVKTSHPHSPSKRVFHRKHKWNSPQKASKYTKKSEICTFFDFEPWSCWSSSRIGCWFSRCLPVSRAISSMWISRFWNRRMRWPTRRSVCCNRCWFQLLAVVSA